MPVVGAYEAKTKLSELLERVSKGERFVITKHGVPVAILEAADIRKASDPEKVIEKIKNFRKGRLLGNITVKEMIEEGRV